MIKLSSRLSSKMTTTTTKTKIVPSSSSSSRHRDDDSDSENSQTLFLHATSRARRPDRRPPFFLSSSSCDTFSASSYNTPLKMKSSLLRVTFRLFFEDSFSCSILRTTKNTKRIQMIEVILNDRLGKKIRVKCNEDDTIGDLKKLVAAQTGTRPEKIRY